MSYPLYNTNAGCTDTYSKSTDPSKVGPDPTERINVLTNRAKKVWKKRKRRKVYVDEKIDEPALNKT